MSRSISDLAAGFNDCTLPKAEWTHEAHLRVGLWHLLHHDPDESLDRLRTGIRKYNAATGGTNTETSGYHETITRFYFWLLSQFVENSDPARPVEELEVAMLRVCSPKEIPFEYWSRERLLSIDARLAWLEPDLKPLVQL